MISITPWWRRSPPFCRSATNSSWRRDSTDGTTELLRSINDPKVKIIETVWDPKRFVSGASNADQTNIALDACTGDWGFYLQADEVVHEKYLPGLVERHARGPG